MQERLNVQPTILSATILVVFSSPGFVMVQMTVEMALMKITDMLVVCWFSCWISTVFSFIYLRLLKLSLFPIYLSTIFVFEVIIELMKIYLILFFVRSIYESYLWCNFFLILLYFIVYTSWMLILLIYLHCSTFEMLKLRSKLKNMLFKTIFKTLEFLNKKKNEQFIFLILNWIRH